MLAASRLVTVTGVGGVGKTRVALRVAAEVRKGFRDGAWWVELSTLTTADLLAETVLAALGIRDRTPRPQLQTLADHLAERRLLLGLDTCEHLVDACADLAMALLRAAPGLRILATSRQSLGVSGEQLFPVAPLPVPGPAVDAASRFQAVTLFVERAREVDAGFALTSDK